MNRALRGKLVDSHRDERFTLELTRATGSETKESKSSRPSKQCKYKYYPPRRFCDALSALGYSLSTQLVASVPSCRLCRGHAVCGWVAVCATAQSPRRVASFSLPAAGLFTRGVTIPKQVSVTDFEGLQVPTHKSGRVANPDPGQATLPDRRRNFFRRKIRTRTTLDLCTNLVGSAPTLPYLCKCKDFHCALSPHPARQSQTRRPPPPSPARPQSKSESCSLKNRTFDVIS